MDAWDIPLYPAAMVGRLVALRPERVRRWLQGYHYSYPYGPEMKIRTRHKDPVIKRTHQDDSSYASFLDLIDLLFVKKFLSYGLSLQKVRKALNEADELIGGHHFAQKQFFTDGKNIYLLINQKNEALMELLSGGQWVIAPVIKELAHQIEFDELTGFARRWYPPTSNGLIVLDPRISFGRPTIVNKGISTAIIYDSFIGEEEDVEQVCSWMNLHQNEVEAAVHFERQLMAA